MNQPVETWEERFLAVAQQFPYPPTPDIAGAVRQKRPGEKLSGWQKPFAVNRRLAFTIAAVVLVFLVGLMAIPGVRAAVIEFLQIGAIRIIPSEDTPTPAILNTPTTMPAKILNPPTPQIQKPRDLIKLDDLEGETTFAQAIRQASFPLHLPAFPSDLGQPDRAFVQDLGGAMVVFVWTEEDNPERAELVLFQIAPGSWAGEKGAPPALQHTQVNGNPAIWAEGPYVLALKNGNRDFRRLIVGHVLIWEENGVTYRLESNLSLEQAEKIAESLAPLP